MKSLKQIPICVLIVFLSVSSAIADSVDNVFRSISILASIGEFQSGVNGTNDISQAQFKWMTEQYRLAYEIGKNYKSREIKKKLGRKFHREWKRNVKAMKTISFYYTRLQEEGGRLSNNEIKDLSEALHDMENFRLFYISWRKG